MWEKIKTGISAKLAADPDPANVSWSQDSMAAGLAWVEAQEVGGTMTPEIEEAYRQADEAILGFLKLMLGLDQVTWAGSAAAPMPLEVARFMAGLGIKVFDVYGMTETCGAITANGPGAFKLGTVGRATPGIEVRLGEDGEVLVRGPVTTPGYYRQAEATRALIDDDGWVHTGDIGTIDDDGFFAIVDRKKELIITSAGKNIAPSNIENYLKESPIVGHAMAFGDNRPYVVAVLTLDGEVAPRGRPADGHRVHRPRRPRAEAGDPGDGPGGRRQRQRAALAARAGQGVRAAADRVDRRVRGADADAQAQAPRREHQVRRRPRPSLQPGNRGGVMVASVVRGIGSVLTVLVAILVTTRAGETATAKVVAAAFSAAVLIALEWFVRWSPRHLQWARRHLDERSVWTGVWVQTVTDAWSASGREDENHNNFSVFRVLYGADSGYVLVGRAYDDAGNEVAEWESTEGATFSTDGRRLSYTWQGKTREPGGGVDPERTGLATMKLRPGESDNGTGDVQHVGINRQLDVEFEAGHLGHAAQHGTGQDVHPGRPGR